MRSTQGISTGWTSSSCAFILRAKSEILFRVLWGVRVTASIGPSRNGIDISFDAGGVERNNRARISGASVEIGTIMVQQEDVLSSLQSDGLTGRTPQGDVLRVREVWVRLITRLITRLPARIR